jgi:hypothetical protein
MKTKKNERRFLSYGEAFGGGDWFELVPFTPDPKYPEQKDCFLLKPVSNKPRLEKMTKKQLIEYIQELSDD